MVFCNQLKLALTGYLMKCHNPYFNRWFSAIKNNLAVVQKDIESQSLF